MFDRSRIADGEAPRERLRADIRKILPGRIAQRVLELHRVAAFRRRFEVNRCGSIRPARNACAEEALSFARLSSGDKLGGVTLLIVVRIGIVAANLRIGSVRTESRNAPQLHLLIVNRHACTLRVAMQTIVGAVQRGHDHGLRAFEELIRDRLDKKG